MKTDARVRYTRMRIKDAFFTCLAEKPVNRITVKELCELAEINRATFYKHYMDAFDLLDKLEEEALENLKRILRAWGRDSWRRMLIPVLRAIQDERNPYAALLSKNGDPNFSTRIWELFYREFQPRMAQNLPNRTPEERQDAYLFVAGGSSNLMAAWIKGGMRTPVEQVAAVLDEMCAAFVSAYGKQE